MGLGLVVEECNASDSDKDGLKKRQIMKTMPVLFVAFLLIIGCLKASVRKVRLEERLLLIDQNLGRKANVGGANNKGLAQSTKGAEDHDPNKANSNWNNNDEDKNDDLGYAPPHLLVVQILILLSPIRKRKKRELANEPDNDGSGDGQGGSSFATGQSDDELSTNYGGLDLEALSRLDGRRWSSSCRSQEGLELIAVNRDGEEESMTESIRTLSQKYRPMFFEELIGQNIVVQSLMNAILRGRVASLYLFQGPRGTGKTSTARVLAAALNCLASNKTKPCGVCRECSEFILGNVLRQLPVLIDHEDVAASVCSNGAGTLQANAKVVPLRDRELLGDADASLGRKVDVGANDKGLTARNTGAETTTKIKSSSGTDDNYDDKNEGYGELGHGSSTDNHHYYSTDKPPQQPTHGSGNKVWPLYKLSNLHACMHAMVIN
ncbi:LOW QUALITY PROTEIN: hypothetical protein RJ639_012381 [Escallonia herrerae]|uniref:Uncharacterized protein n=1 Tax=Escallonia herrerae TaxID=1293975 RepID=A0AA88VP23_9ASTE|nr:LOW QUALITY PROTEIN: hypothetical protein RJ639_012381 [Escallonia herrerae]